jgi:hypothetical protein
MNDSDPKEKVVWAARAIAYLAYGYILLVQFVLVQGFLLLLLGANTGSSYVDWAYRSLERVMAPFRGIFESIDLTGQSVLDTSVLFAMVMYGILGLAVHSLLDWLTYRLRRLEHQRLRDEARAEAEAEAALMRASIYGVPGQAPSGYTGYDPSSSASQPAAPTTVQPQTPQGQSWAPAQYDPTVYPDGPPR